jgi:hypothetical protein
MSSPKQRLGRPVESVELKLTFRADKETCHRIRKEIPSAVFRAGKCEVVIRGEVPTEVAKRAKMMLEAALSKGFK